MFKSFRVLNFRGFRDLTAANLDRINLIAGENNVGKTALLEALHLPHHMNPRLLVRDPRLRAPRDRPSRRAFAAQYEDQWNWLFYGRDAGSLIYIEEVAKQGTEISAQIRLSDTHEPIQVDLPLPGASDSDDEEDESEATIANYFRQLEMKLIVSGAGPAQTATARVAARHSLPRLRVRYSKPPRLPFPILSRGIGRGVSDLDAERFSELERRGEHSIVLETAKHVDARISRLSVQVLEGRPTLYADIGLKEIMPVHMLGEGFNSVVSILLTIAAAPGGVVLVDEIENGLHWSVLPNVWRSLALAARAADSQLFVTTHSWECIRVAHEVLSADVCYDLKLHRLDRKNGEVSVVSYDREMLDAALVMGLEMR